MRHLSGMLSPVVVHFMASPLFVMHSSIDGHLDSLQALAAENIRAQGPVETCAVFSLR